MYPIPMLPGRFSEGRRFSNWQDPDSPDGFGPRTPPHGSGISYVGSFDNPWGSKIIMIEDQYKHTIKFVGSSNVGQAYRVVAWNKVGPNGGLNGWYGNFAVSFSFAPGGVPYVAFDEDSQGGFGAAHDGSLQKNRFGGYNFTWARSTSGAR